jgi:hypothetical protein
VTGKICQPDPNAELPHLNFGGQEQEERENCEKCDTFRGTTSSLQYNKERERVRASEAVAAWPEPLSGGDGEE